mgnify:CR=1 FL=1
MDIESQVQAIDHAALSDPVRRATRDPSFEVIDWSYRSIYAPIMATTGGVYRFSGSGRTHGELTSWSVVLKVVRSLASAGLNDQVDDETAAVYWQRDSLLYQSGLLDDLPGGLAAPRCLQVTKPSPGVIWMWLEDIVDELPRWPPERYALAARHLGAFNGIYLVGRPLPDQRWLNRGVLRWRTDQATRSFAALPGLREHPAVRATWPDDLIDQVLRLWGERERFFAAVDRLPQTLCHLDAGRLNLFARRSPARGEETVAIDWGYAGIGAVGQEVASLVVGSPLRFQDIEPAQLPEIADRCFAGYLTGLGDAGWRGDPEAVRLGYLVDMAMRYGLFLALEVVATDPAGRARIERTFGRPAEQVCARVADVRRFVLDQVEEAREIIGAE